MTIYLNKIIIYSLISFIRSEKQIKVKGILNSLGVKTPIAI